MHVYTKRAAIDLGCTDLHKIEQPVFQPGAFHPRLQGKHRLEGERIGLCVIDTLLHSLCSFRLTASSGSADKDPFTYKDEADSVL